MTFDLCTWAMACNAFPKQTNKQKLKKETNFTAVLRQYELNIKSWEIWRGIETLTSYFLQFVSIYKGWALSSFLELPFYCFSSGVWKFLAILYYKLCFLYFLCFLILRVKWQIWYIYIYVYFSNVHESYAVFSSIFFLAFSVSFVF